MAPEKKQSFLHGAALLTAATVIVKFLGALYKIPLGNIIDDAGFGYFNTAYDIYAMLLTISTTGLPVALSRMIAQSGSLGHHRQLQRTMHTALGMFVVLGTLGSILMVAFCKPLANWMNSPNSWAAIAALGPASLLMCLTSAFRGFFQGQGNMLPTSVSQVLEAFCKLVVGLVLAWIIMGRTHNTAYAAAGAILGVTLGSLASTIYTHWKYRDVKSRLTRNSGPVDSYGDTAKKLLAIAVPITIGSAGLQIITLLDAKVFMGRLMGAAGCSQEVADGLKGIYNFAQSVFGLPTAFVSPIAISILPAITSQLTLRNARGARRTEEAAVRVVGLITLPCAVGLLVLAEPIMALLRGYTGETLQTASSILAVLGVCVIFSSLVTLTTTIMQAHGYVYIPVINTFVGGIVKIVVNYILVGDPRINIQGAPFGTLCCYLCITILNLYTMRRMMRHAPNVLRHLIKPMIASVLMGAVALVSWKLLGHVTASRLVLCGGPIALAAVAYLALVLALKVVTYEDCMLLPKGEKIARLLRISAE